MQQVGGVFDLYLAVGGVEARFGTEQQQPRLAKLNVALERHLAALLVDRRAIAAHLTIALRYLNIALEYRALIVDGVGLGGAKAQCRLLWVEVGVGILPRRFDVCAAAVGGDRGALFGIHVDRFDPVEVVAARAAIVARFECLACGVAGRLVGSSRAGRRAGLLSFANPLAIVVGLTVPRSIGALVCHRRSARQRQQPDKRQRNGRRHDGARGRSLIAGLPSPVVA